MTGFKFQMGTPVVPADPRIAAWDAYLGRVQPVVDHLKARGMDEGLIHLLLMENQTAIQIESTQRAVLMVDEKLNLVATGLNQLADAFNRLAKSIENHGGDGDEWKL